MIGELNSKIVIKEEKWTSLSGKVVVIPFIENCSELMLAEYFQTMRTLVNAGFTNG